MNMKESSMKTLEDGLDNCLKENGTIKTQVLGYDQWILNAIEIAEKNGNTRTDIKKLLSKYK